MILCSGGNHSPGSAITVRNAPENAVGKSLPDSVELRQKRTPEGFHQEHAFAMRRLFELASFFGCAERQRLLDEDMLSSFNPGEGTGEAPGGGR